MRWFRRQRDILFVCFGLFFHVNECKILIELRDQHLGIFVVDSFKYFNQNQYNQWMRPTFL